MDYKEIIKDRKTRFVILKFLSFVPDSWMCRLQYRIKVGRWPNLKHPKRFTEKLQLYKLRYRNPILSECVDKLRVRDFIKSKGLGNILNGLLGVYKKAEDIPFEDLPFKFVIKTNDGGGGNNILICKDKSRLDIPASIRELNSWLNVKKVNPAREWAYTGIKESVFVVEEFIENENNPEGGLEDFKFFCFDGVPRYVVHDGDRYIGHKRNFYNTEWNNLNVGSDCERFPGNTPKPHFLNEMLNIARKLSKGFPFVRVDLYQTKDRVIFGELTFYPWSGYVNYDPDDFDFELGRNFDEKSL